MTHADAGHYAAKHPNEKIVPAIAEAIAVKEKEGSITCAAAHTIARKAGCDPSVVGINIDLLEKRIRRCQLGLFGYGVKNKKAVKPASMVAAPLKRAIRKAMGGKGHLGCLSAWNLAQQQGLTKLELASACEAMGVKIKTCQLGAF